VTTLPTGVARLAEESGPLVKVEAIPAANGRMHAVDLHFALGVLSLRSDDETDEVIVSTEAEPLRGPDVIKDTTSGLAGLTIEYVWTLINHRGYVDGLQLRLVDGQGREETRQFEVMASVLEVSEVTPRPDSRDSIL
jgi:Family of unknown function (DUF6334)